MKGRSSTDISDSEATRMNMKGVSGMTMKDPSTYSEASRRNMNTVDEEWASYLMTNFSTTNGSNAKVKDTKKMDPPTIVNTPPVKIVSHQVIDDDDDRSLTVNTELLLNNAAPVCDDLYISTKTKVLFLNQEIDIHQIFWKIPVIEYWQPKIGVIKKQIKIVSKTPEEYDEYRKKLENIGYHKETIIKQIDNQNSRRIKYRDERKITIGISKKDIMNCRSKVKNAFYNCFALIMRFRYDSIFREIHIKVFNTGKLEIPGILNPELLENVKKMLLQQLQPYIDTHIDYLETDSEENVLINSNFNCGFYINREKLYHILRSEKYRIEGAYDPCSYPGVKCKYYFNNNMGFSKDQNGQILLEDRNMKMSELGENRKYTEISFMIFRTGSCLIVGNCTERILKFVFEFIKQILKEEYDNIVVINEDPVIKIKKTKLRKKTIIVHNVAGSTDPSI